MLSVSMVCAVAGYIYSYHDFAYRSTVEGSRGIFHIAFYGVSQETAEKIAAESVFEENHEIRDSLNGEEGTFDVHLRFEKSVKTPDDHIWEIQEKYNISSLWSNTELMALEGYDVGGSSMTTIYQLAAILIVIIAASSIIVIANSFTISATERVKQFGLLKSVGATGKQIGQSVLFEALILALIAIPLGIALGFAVQGGSLAILNKIFYGAKILKENAPDLRMVFAPAIIIITIAVSFATVLLSALRPARRAAKTPAIDSIRQNTEVRVRKKELRVSRLTHKLFGIEGVLAAKTLKRNKRKQRAAVAALAVSVVLFVGVSSFVGMLNRSITAIYEISEHNVQLSLYNGSLEQQKEIMNYLAAHADYDYTIKRDISILPNYPDGFYTDEYYVWLKGKYINIEGLSIDSRLVAIPDAEFEKLAPNATGEIPGVLVNATGATFYKGKSRSFTPFAISPGQKIEAEIRDSTMSNSTDNGMTTDETTMYEPQSKLLTVTLAAEIKTVPETFPSNYWGGAANILIPESVYDEIALSFDVNIYLSAFITAGDTEAVCTELQERLSESEKGYLNIYNLEEGEKSERTVSFVVALFGYGFIAMLSLIAVTSVISTISTGMALRRQEFAMLFSVGMTGGGTMKMLNLESLLYGLKSLLIGLPLGIGVSYALYKAFQNSMEFPYSFPLLPIVISAAAVFLLTFVTMHYGRRKLRKINIVEAVRNETA
jgi:putative ABC transport system permease protein